MKFFKLRLFFFPVREIDKLFFTKHMSMMLRSGITIAEAISIVTLQTKSKIFREILSRVKKDIENGNSLAKSLKKQQKIFDSFYISLIDVGENSGTLDKTLEYLATHLTREYTFRQKLRGVLLYPVIVLTAAFIIGLVISLFILPQLVNVFSGFDFSLPFSTRILLALASFMKLYGLIVVAAALLVVIIIRFAIKTSSIKPLWDTMLLSLPFLGIIVQDAELATFTRSIGLMLQSGLTISSSLEIAGKMNTNTVFQDYSKRLFTAINKGNSLSSELEKNHYTKVPLLVTKMIAVGEETGKLDETLLYLGDFFESEVDNETKNLPTVIEPLMLIIIGIVVAFLAFAIISPIYQLSGSIHK